MSGAETRDDEVRQTICLTSFSHLATARVRAILRSAGYQPKFGWPSAADTVAIWGTGKTAQRGHALARPTGATPVFLEDAFLRSLAPGRAGEPPLGLIVDRRGLYYDARQPSDLEDLLANHPLNDADLLARARDARARQIAADVTKFAARDGSAPPKPGYVLVVDQAYGDASVPFGSASDATFREMLETARAEHPGERIVLRQHPETAYGLRPGYLDARNTSENVELSTGLTSPWALLAGARAVYTVTSQLGFEAILAGHRPVVFGQPFYAGWGLSDDRSSLPRRVRRLSVDQLYAAAMILYPRWYDPFRDRGATLEQVIDTLEVQMRAAREDTNGAVAHGVRLWKRRAVRRVFSEMPVRFVEDASKALHQARTRSLPLLVWASRATDTLVAQADAVDVPLCRVEDGFLRSRGLGAELVPPLSLVRDSTGIYYDPRSANDLEHAIMTACSAPEAVLRRAAALRAQIVRSGISKYNLTGSTARISGGDRPVVLVVGQVADDASIRCGTDGDIRTNAALLSAARIAHPDAYLVYKPHPDVEAGLRPGAIDAADADEIAKNANPLDLIARADRVWTMCSLLGFEALLRGVDVTCTGRPFYAGWGLTDDLPSGFDKALEKRRGDARPSLDALVHAALIAYPRYLDPVTNRTCPPEVAVERLSEPGPVRTGRQLRALSKLQGLLASQAWIWR